MTSTKQHLGPTLIFHFISKSCEYDKKQNQHFQIPNICNWVTIPVLCVDNWMWHFLPPILLWTPPAVANSPRYISAVSDICTRRHPVTMKTFALIISFGLLALGVADSSSSEEDRYF